MSDARRKTQTERDDAFASHVGGLTEAAENYIDEVIGPERALGTSYYHGAPFGDEESGRSSFVSRDVRDTVHALLPSLLRIFFGPKDILTFTPNGPGTADVAAQATDVVRNIVETENDGFGILYSAIKDALIRKTGVLTWYYDDGLDLRFEEREGLSELDMLVLMDEPDVEVRVLKEYADPAAEAQPAEPDPMTGLPAEAPNLYDIRLRREAKRRNFVLVCLPPEEFIITRNARSVADADLCGWQRKVPEHELLAMGYTAEQIEPHLGHSELEDNEEVLARDPDSATDLGELTPRALYAEVYTRYDLDGDGYPELRKVCLIGSGREVLHSEYADEAPFSILCPDPEPHRWVGQSVSDATMDIQRVKSYMIRSMFDSLAQSVHPRMAVVDSQVNIEDLLNNENGGYVRMRQPGMVQPLDTPFVGQQVLPVLAYMDEVKENRTGISKAAAGLDADALQSSTRAAVAATVSASHQQVEMIARLLTAGLKPVFMGLYRLFKKHQDRARVIRLRGEWVEVDPRTWPTELDLTVDVGGTGDEEMASMFLTQLAGKQEEILTTHGLDNPLVTLRQYRNTLGRLVQLGGFRNVSEFFKDVPEDYQAPPAQPPQDPAMEAVKLEGKVQEAKLALQRLVEQAKDDRERDKQAQDFFIARKDLELKYATMLDTAEVNAEVARDRNAQQAQAAAQRPAPGAAE